MDQDEQAQSHVDNAKAEIEKAYENLLNALLLKPNWKAGYIVDLHETAQTLNNIKRRL